MEVSKLLPMEYILHIFTVDGPEMARTVNSPKADLIVDQLTAIKFPVKSFRYRIDSIATGGRVSLEARTVPDFSVPNNGLFRQRTDWSKARKTLAEAMLRCMKEGKDRLFSQSSQTNILQN